MFHDTIYLHNSSEVLLNVNLDKTLFQNRKKLFDIKHIFSY